MYRYPPSLTYIDVRWLSRLSLYVLAAAELHASCLSQSDDLLRARPLRAVVLGLMCPGAACVYVVKHMCVRLFVYSVVPCGKLRNF